MSPPLRSTSARLALAIMVSFLFAFLLLGVGTYYAVAALLIRDTREVVRVDAAGLMEVYQKEGRRALSAEVAERTASADNVDALYALIGRNGKVEAGAPVRLPAEAAHASRARWIEFVENQDDGPVRIVASLHPVHGGVLLTGQRIRTVDRFLELMLRAALAALLVAVALGASIGWLASHWVSRRLGNIDRTVARVGDGELDIRVSLDGSDDAFDHLARRFNIMLDRIEELMGGVRHATDHIAHDLRTPLTRLRNRLEELRDKPEGRDRDDAVDAAVAETDQLLQSFGALLRLARIEAQAPVQDEPVLDLADVAQDAVELYTPIALDRGVALAAQVAAACRVHGDADQLFQMLVNLLDNAVKYAPPGSQVLLTVRAGEGWAELWVDDHGPGIPKADRERVFDRFQRLEPNRASPGTGLGMSLVRAIVRRHGGQVSLDDNQPGLRVRIVLPLA